MRTETLRTYYVTVRNPTVALNIDPEAVHIRTLPATKLFRTYCCRPADVAGEVPVAYVYKVRVKYRKEAEKAKGVIRCRAKEPEHYKTVLCRQVC